MMDLDDGDFFIDGEEGMIYLSNGCTLPISALLEFTKLENDVYYYKKIDAQTKKIQVVKMTPEETLYHSNSKMAIKAIEEKQKFHKFLDKCFETKLIGEDDDGEEGYSG